MLSPDSLWLNHLLVLSNNTAIMVYSL